MSEAHISLEAEISKAKTLLNQPGLPKSSTIDPTDLEPTPSRIGSVIEEYINLLASDPISHITVAQLAQFNYEPTLEDPSPLRIKLKNALVRDLNPKIRISKMNTDDIFWRALLATTIDIAQNGLTTRGVFPDIDHQVGFWVLKSLMWHQEEVSSHYFSTDLRKIIDPDRYQYIQGLEVLIPLLNGSINTDRIDDALSRQLVTMFDVLRVPHNMIYTALNLPSLRARGELSYIRSRMIKLALAHHQLLDLKPFVPEEPEFPPDPPSEIIQEQLF